MSVHAKHSLAAEKIKSKTPWNENKTKNTPSNWKVNETALTKLRKAEQTKSGAIYWSANYLLFLLTPFPLGMLRMHLD